MDLPKRKPQRLAGYDYGQNGAYFVTICTQKHIPLFGEITNGVLFLNNAGKMISNTVADMAKYKPDIEIAKYVIMPNHIHMIFIIQYENKTHKPHHLPTLSDYIHRFKSFTTRLYINGVKAGEYPPFKKRLWQKSFYDRIIRNEQEYLQVWEYIDTNPLKWEVDKYYREK